MTDDFFESKIQLSKLTGPFKKDLEPVSGKSNRWLLIVLVGLLGFLIGGIIGFVLERVGVEFGGMARLMQTATVVVVLRPIVPVRTY